MNFVADTAAALYFASMAAALYTAGRYSAACEALNLALKIYDKLKDWRSAGACGGLIIMIRSKFC